MWSGGRLWWDNQVMLWNSKWAAGDCNVGVKSIWHFKLQMVTGSKVNIFVRWQWRKWWETDKKIWKNKSYVAFTQYPWSMCCLLPLLLCFFILPAHIPAMPTTHQPNYKEIHTHAYKHNISASIHAPSWH